MLPPSWQKAQQITSARDVSQQTDWNTDLCGGQMLMSKENVVFKSSKTERYKK